MSNFVFIHGPGAGGCADSFIHQLRHFPNSLAPTLPGHPEGTACQDVERYTEWVRGWLWLRARWWALISPQDVDNLQPVRVRTPSAIQTQRILMHWQNSPIDAWSYLNASESRA